MKVEEINDNITRAIIETAKDFPEEYKIKLLNYANELNKKQTELK